jgi:hypothetical protein
VPVLKHWHCNIGQFIWDQKHAWFDYGTIQSNTNAMNEVNGISFEVPKDDIFCEEPGFIQKQP